jgi:hypothetical protein
VGSYRGRLTLRSRVNGLICTLCHRTFVRCMTRRACCASGRLGCKAVLSCPSPF